VTPEGTDKLGIWNDHDQVMPTDWLNATASLRGAAQEIEPTAPTRRESVWWQVSVVTLMASLLGFTVGAGAGRFREPDLTSPWQQLVLEGTQVAPQAAGRADTKSHKVARRSNNSRRIKLAAAEGPRLATKVKGLRITRTVSSASVAVATTAATTNRQGAHVVVINREEGSGGSGGSGGGGGHTASNPAPNSNGAEPSPQPSPTQEADESDHNFDNPDNNNDDASEPDDTDPEEPADSEEEEESGPGNSDNAPGHNKDDEGGGK
jgi:hypothetical protein